MSPAPAPMSRFTFGRRNPDTLSVLVQLSPETARIGQRRRDIYSHTLAYRVSLHFFLAKKS